MISYNEQKRIIEARISSLKHIKTFIEINLKAQREKLKELENN